MRVDPEPFAKGSNGAIYNAVLRTPPAVLQQATDRLGPEIHVVVKQILPEFEGQDIRKKILHEVFYQDTFLLVLHRYILDRRHVEGSGNSFSFMRQVARHLSPLGQPRLESFHIR